MKGSGPAISVVIPAYNAEEFIDECLESILSQTFTDMEIIVVNDASKDSTLLKIQSIAAKDPRIRVINLPFNKGLSGARNAGIEEAKGEFLCFVDSDDCLQPFALQTMYEATQKENADICRVGFYRGFQFKVRSVKKIKYDIYHIPEALRLTLYQKIKMNPAWGMLIKSELVRDAGNFREGTWYEDLDSFYRFFDRANRILYIKNPLYFYRENPLGFLSSWSDSRLDVLEVTDRMVEYFRQYHPELTNAAEDRRFSAHFNILMLMYKHGIQDPDSIKRCISVVKEGRSRAITDPKVRLKNKLGALLSYCGTPMLRLIAKIAP